MPLTIEVIHGDITECPVQAIVNAANNHLWMGSGVAGAIKSKGGEIVEREAVAKGPIMPGEAVATTAGRLPYKYVIHGAVMGQGLRTDATLIRQTTIACLNLADQLGLESLALPAFGTGVGRFPGKACARIMVETVDNWQTLAKTVAKVQFCLFDDVACKLFKDALAARKKSKQ